MLHVPKNLSDSGRGDYRVGGDCLQDLRTDQAGEPGAERSTTISAVEFRESGELVKSRARGADRLALPTIDPSGKTGLRRRWDWSERSAR